jgi:hypothetical protein
MRDCCWRPVYTMGHPMVLVWRTLWKDLLHKVRRTKEIRQTLLVRRTLCSKSLHKVRRTNIPWYLSDGLYEKIYFIKSDGPKKSVGLCWSVGLYVVNHFIKSVGPVPWDIPSCKRVLRDKTLLTWSVFCPQAAWFSALKDSEGFIGGAAGLTNEVVVVILTSWYSLLIVCSGVFRFNLKVWKLCPNPAKH